MICQICSTNPGQIQFMGMTVCPPCKDKEEKLQEELDNTAEDRVNEFNRVMDLAKAEEIDSSIRISADLHNAETISLVEVKKLIDNDSSIENKEYALAHFVADRIKNWKQAIFKLDQERLEYANKLHADQVFLHSLSDKLRQDERDKLKLKDLSYTPPIPKSKSVKRKRKGIKLTELKKLSKESGIDEFMIRTISLQRNVDLDEAVRIIQESFPPGNEKKDESYYQK